MTIYLQNIWLEFGDADDIVAHCKDQGLKLEVRTRKELMDMNTQEFLDGVYFCDTDIVQHHIKQANGYDFLVPDTYDPAFSEFFRRQIEKMTFGEYSKRYSGTLRFIKPAGNDKFFSGHVLFGPSELQSFEPIPPDYLIYVCEPVLFRTEERLLIGQGRLYGSAYMSGSPISDKGFVETLVKITGDRFCCVDIGQLVNPVSKELELAVVEINPPFSLDDYGMPFSDYFSFCQDACKYIREHLRW